MAGPVRRVSRGAAATVAAVLLSLCFFAGFAPAAQAQTNTAPTVGTSIPDQVAVVGTAFSYAFPATTFADADSDALTYTASETQVRSAGLPSWLSFDRNTRTFSGTPAAGDTGPVTVRVTANDGNGGTVSDEFVIVVSATSTATVSIFGPSDTDEADVDRAFGIALNRPLVGNEAIQVRFCFSGTATRKIAPDDTGFDYDLRSSAQLDNILAVSECINFTVFANAFPSGRLTVDAFTARVFEDMVAEADETVSATLNILVAPDDFSLGTATASFTIRNEDAITVQWGTASVSVDEDAGEVRLPIRMDAPRSTASQFFFSNVPVTAIHGGSADYGPVGTSVIIPAGDTEADVVIPIRDDTSLEEAEIFVLLLSSNLPTGTVLGTRDRVTVTITDDDTPNTAPTVSTAIPDRDATVGAAFSYAFPANTFTDADSDALTYSATLSDSTALPTWLSFTPGSRTFAGTPAAGDTGTVTVRVTADDGNGGTVSDDFVITVSTVSAPALVFRQGTQAVTAVAVGEGGTTTYTVELAQQPTGNVTVTITSDDTGAVTVDDTDTVTNGTQNTLSFTDTTWDDPQTVRVRGVADDDTTNEDVTLTHTAAGGNYAGVTGTLDVAVTDTTLPALSIVAKRTEGLSLNAADELVYPEDAVLATFTATLSMVPTANFDVCVRVTETGADRVALASEGIVTQRFVTMESGQTSQDFTISWTDDATDEVDSVVTVEAVDPSTAGCSATNGSYGLDAVDVAAKARIEDNDATLVSLVRSGAGAIDEGGTAEFTVTLARALVAGERIDVPLSIAGTDVTTDDWSLALKPGDGLNTGVTLTGATTATPQLRFAGAAAETATLVLTATTDSVTESAETITVALGPDQTPVDNAFDALVDDSSDRHTAPTGTNVGGGADPHGTNNAFNIVVNNVAPNRAPTVGTAIPDRDATVGAAFSYAFPATTFVDADSDALSYTATQSDGSVLPTWLSFTAGSRSFAGTPAAGDTGPVTVRVTANDGNGGTVSDDFVITVHPAPALVLAPAEDVSVDEGDTARYTVRLAGKPTGDVTVTIASDDTGAVTVADTDAVADGPQNTLSFTTTDWNSAQSVTVRGVEDDDATDEDVALTHSAAGGNYAGVTGTLAVRVSDDETPNRSPTVDAGLVDQSATVGAAFSYAFAATTFADADNDPLSYSAAGPQNAALPSWLTFTANTRTLTGTPPDAAAGTVVIVWITANDGNGGTVSDDLSITVSAAPNRSPTVSTAIPDQDATVGTAFSYAFAATTFADADSDALAYTATQSDGSALPGWLSFTAGSRLFSGTPAAGDTGPVTVRVTADDGNGGTVSDDFVITVSAAPNRSPTVDTAIPDRDATVGAAFSYAFPATTFVDADSDALSYTATQSDGSVLPTWLSFTAGSRSFAGTPAAGDTGPVTVRVTANDGNGGTVSDDFVITVHPAPALVLAPAEDVSVDEGDTARYTVRLAGKPTGDVTVTIASDDTGAVTVADTDAVADGPQNTLSFTTTDWNSAQSVTVRGVEDDDATDEDVALTHSAAGGNYAGVTGTLAVRVSDDDMRDDLAAAAADAGLVRFGRTVGEQSVSAVRDRLSADRRQGFTGSLAGQALPSMDGTAASVNDGTASSPVNEAVNEAAGPGAEISEDAELAGSGAGSGGPTAVTALRSWLAGPGDAVDAGAGAQVRALDATDIVAGTSFALTRETDGGGTLALWGRGVHSGFSGQQGGIDIDGRVTGFQLGADHARGDWTYGLMVSRSTGDIEYSAAQGGGEIGLDLTALVPYVGWDVTAGLSAWGTLGFGRGDMTLTPETPETPDGGAVLRSDIDWQMAAAGVEGILTPSTRVLGGAALNWHADALWTRTRADALPGRRGAPGGETTRLRFGLESRWQHSLASGGVLTPQLEMALRHDGGDAETGFGLEIGGGLDWSAPERGLSLGLSGRTLALHEDGSFGDWGVSVVLDYDPAPDTKRGFAARLSHDLGGSASGGAQALLGPESFPGLNAASGGGRWALETAYGVSRGRGRVGSSYMALSGADAVAATRLGYRLEPDAPHAEDVSVDVWAEPALQPPTNPRNTNNHRLGMDLNWKW